MNSTKQTSKEKGTTNWREVARSVEVVLASICAMMRRSDLIRTPKWEKCRDRPSSFSLLFLLCFTFCEKNKEEDKIKRHQER